MGDEAEWLPGADPDKEWRRGLAHLVRLRTILGAAISNTIGFGAIWKWVDLARAIPFLVAGTAGVGVLVVSRLAIKRACSTGDRFHRVCHELRERCEKLATADTDATYAERLSTFNGGLAEDIAEFFRVLMWDPTIHCTIRLAAKSPTDSYVTVGRSLRMNASRERQSEPIPANRGVPHFLMTMNNLGVCLIRDIEKAGKSPSWHATKNDALPDVRVLAIAPINSYESGIKSMYGMLCVTSARKRIGHAAIEPLKGFADILGFMYAAIKDDRRPIAKGLANG